MQGFSSYRVLARAYRPTCFAHVVGQSFLLQTLRHGFEAGRLAHAFLLSGAHGIGKTTIARLLARCLNFDEKPLFDIPEDQWGVHCKAILNAEHIDVIEMDAASHTGVEDIRSILESMPYAPTLARYKIFIIDEAHMLSKSAFNALLKTLEEPPPYVKFIFATTEIQKIPITVLSRCQRFKLIPLSQEDLASLCYRVLKKEGFHSLAGALDILVHHAQGSARDALSLLDQVIACHPEKEKPISRAHVQEALGLVDEHRILCLFIVLVRAQAREALELAHTFYSLGTRPDSLIQELLEFIHDLSLCLVDKSFIKDLLVRWCAQGHDEKIIIALLAELNMATLSHMWQILAQGLEDVRLSFRSDLTADMVFVRFMYAMRLPDLATFFQEKRDDRPLTLQEKIQRHPLVSSLVTHFPEAKLEKCEAVGEKEKKP